jgi:GntR family transcriptional regulator, transcriptional repressor for pyruvate dehydrogenase complex
MNDQISSVDRRTDRRGMLEPVLVPRAPDILAAKLRDIILSGRIPAGGTLPTERELVTQSGLSRASVREALRVLEVEGLISTRVGRSGGSTVTLPGRASVARSLELFVRSQGVRLEALLECRIGVEPLLASLAAQKRTEAQLTEMRSIHEQFAASVDDIATYKKVNLDWHLAVARASGNEPLIAFMEAISQPILAASSYHRVTTDEARHEAVRTHAWILRAIERQDAKSAFSRMERHVSAYSSLAREALVD